MSNETNNVQVLRKNPNIGTSGNCNQKRKGKWKNAFLKSGVQ